MRKNVIDSAAKRSTTLVLKRHEINGNYHVAKKIRDKIKTHAFRPKSRIAITDRKLAERKLREWPVEVEDELHSADSDLRSHRFVKVVSS